MFDNSVPQKYYSRGIAYGDVKGATKNSPVKIARQEFVTRIFNAYLDDIEAALKDFPQANPAT